MSSSAGQNPTSSSPQLCDEIMSWMIEIRMKHHLVSDSNCNIGNLYSPQKVTRNDNNVGLTFSVGDTIPWFTISIEQDK